MKEIKRTGDNLKYYQPQVIFRKILEPNYQRNWCLIMP